MLIDPCERDDLFSGLGLNLLACDGRLAGRIIASVEERRDHLFALGGGTEQQLFAEFNLIAAESVFRVFKFRKLRDAYF